MRRSISAWSQRVAAEQRARDFAVDVGDGAGRRPSRRTPCRRRAGRLASCEPRDAPAGAMARPIAPHAQHDFGFDGRAAAGIPDAAAAYSLVIVVSGMCEQCSVVRSQREIAAHRHARAESAR